MANEIFQVIRDGDFKAAKKLLRVTPGSVHTEEGGDKPLHVAARTAQTVMMHLLLEHGANMNAQNQQGNTALHLAVMRHCSNPNDDASQSLMCLLNFGPILDIENHEGQTAWDEAFACDAEQVCFWLEEAERFQKAHQAGIAEIRYTVADTDEGPEIQSVEATGWDGERVVLDESEITSYGEYFMGRRNWFGGLGKFDDNSPGRLVWDVFTKRVSTDDEQRLAKIFLRAVASGRLETVKSLLAENSALANCISILRRSPSQNTVVKKRTPLSVAAECGRDDICRLLLEAGADVNKADDVYHSAFVAAAWGGHLSTVTLLLKAGAQAEHVQEALGILHSQRVVFGNVSRPDNSDQMVDKLRSVI